MNEHRDRYDDSGADKNAYKSPRITVLTLLSLYQRQSNLPKCIFEEMIRVLDIADSHKAVSGYTNRLNQTYYNVSEYKAEIIAEIMDELKVNNKDDLIEVFRKISNDLKELSKQINPNNILPHETAFADFIVKHIKNLYNVLELYQCKELCDANLLKGKSIDDILKIFDSFSSLLTLPEEQCDFPSMCREFNEKGKFILDALDVVKEMHNEIIDEPNKRPQIDYEEYL
jgi:hypothetical protein